MTDDRPLGVYCMNHPDRVAFVALGTGEPLCRPCYDAVLESRRRRLDTGRQMETMGGVTDGGNPGNVD